MANKLQYQNWWELLPPSSMLRARGNGNLLKKTLGPSSVSRTSQPGTRAPTSQTTVINLLLSPAFTTCFWLPLLACSSTHPSYSLFFPGNCCRPLTQLGLIASLRKYCTLHWFLWTKQGHSKIRRWIVSKPSSTRAHLQHSCQLREGLLRTNPINNNI